MMEYEELLRDALSSWGDLDLRFSDGKSFCVHGLKLALASSVLRALMDDVLDDQLASAAKRRKASDGATGPLPSLEVSDPNASDLELYKCKPYDKPHLHL